MIATKSVTEVPAKTKVETIYKCELCNFSTKNKGDATYHYGGSHSFTKYRKTNLVNVKEMWFFETREDLFEFWKSRLRLQSPGFPAKAWTGSGWYCIDYRSNFSWGPCSVSSLIDDLNANAESFSRTAIQLSNLIKKEK